MSLDSALWIVSGAAGVTAECMIRLASSPRSNSPTFILLGRTSLDPQLAKLSNLDEEALRDDKTKLKHHLDLASSSGKATLKQWEDAWQSRKRAIGIHSTLSRLRDAGASAEYVSVDVTSRSAVDSAIDSIISDHGPITGVVHGAGIEDSTPFHLKSDETVKEVMGVKVVGWSSIYDSLSSRNQPIRFACSFTSVAGRLGNAAQLDYVRRIGYWMPNITEYPPKTSRCQSLGHLGPVRGWQLGDPWRLYSIVRVDMDLLKTELACLSRRYWAQQEHQS